MNAVLLAALLACGRRGVPSPAQPAPAITEGTVLIDGEQLRVQLACPENMPPIDHIEIALWSDRVVIGEGVGTQCTLSVPVSVIPQGTIQITGTATVVPPRASSVLMPIHIATNVQTNNPSPQ